MAAVKTASNYNIYNIIVGLFCLFFIISIFYNKKISYNIYNTYTVVLQSTEGIKLNQDVLIGGAKVGFVENIYLQNNKSYIVVNVNKQYNIPTDSYIFISSPSLISSNKSINIILGIEEDFLLSGDTIYNTNIGLDMDKILDLFSIYLQTTLKK